MPEKKQDKESGETAKLAKKQSGAARLPKARSFPIVAIGGSAGAFPAMEKFFTHMPVDTGMAFVIIMHLDPNPEGQISSVIRNYTAMGVHEATDGITVEPNHIYVIPPNKDMGIHNRRLLLLNAAAPNGFRQPIDYFFQSLADDQWNRAVAIVLSGMGSDGETGIRMIKEKLGLAMVQDPDTAQYDSMPKAAIGTNLADYLLAPEEMPLKLIQYLNHPVMSEEPNEQARSEIRNTTSVQKILMLLRSQTGHDFSLYKKSTIIRRIDRRVAFHQLPDYVHYVNYLRENPQEIDVLFNELLIGVTKFFRDAPAFDSLKLKLAALVQHKKNTEPIRFWIAGCSTGEEAYSVAILLMECLDSQTKKLPKVQLFATDLDGDAIEQARQGNYHGNIAADVSPERLERFFIKTDSGYTIKKDLREMIVFAQHNIIKDAPFTRLDLLCCRNVMIYLTTELQRKIIPVFHYSLHNKGLMFMGPAETIGGFTELFSPSDPKWKIFERKEGSAALNKMIDFPFHVAKQPPNILRSEETESFPGKNSISEKFNNLLLENFTPNSVLINEKGDILYTNGRSGNYLQLPRGEAVMNIHKMAREELRYVLGNVIHQARSQNALVAIHDVKLRDGDQQKLLSLHASPLEDNGLQGLILVVIEEKGVVKSNSRKGKKINGSRNQAAEELERELMYTKQQLNSTIEQMETSLEELKSTNEELQSTNEELQSTNEESLTTKEEMQSLNEELMTVNVQYQSKAEELSRLNNDMKNLLDATEIGTVFLDNNLDILRYTPGMKKLFNIIPSDVGRPLSDIVSNFDYVQVEMMIRDVIDRLYTQEVEVKTKNEDWYSIRIMPYRTLDNFISGAVLTFTLISGFKQMEFRVQALQQYAANTISGSAVPTLQLDRDLNVLTLNKAFFNAFHADERELLFANFPRYAAERWQVNNLETILQRSKTENSAVRERISILGRNYELSGEPFVQEDTAQVLLLILKFHLKDEQ